ncbi:MAG: hypothetical protein C0403_12120 [Desulfobacterium sp.]|nr:hypothetical protein [Desulfobacterium sp.]
MDKIRTILFGMTGLGNSAFEALTEHDKINLVAVLTCKRNHNPFPYYQCEKLYEMASKKGIPVYEGLNLKETSTYEFIHSLSPELIVVSTFDQIITNAIIQIPKYGVINIHPSLLPQYRGTTPTVWALMNGEEETGISIHFIENETIDSGRIILQSRVKIMPEDTDGTLRYRLDQLSKTTLARAINPVLTYDRSSFPPQNELLATYGRKRTIKDAEITKGMPLKKMLTLIRAMTPYPGARILHQGKWHIIKSASLITGASSCQNQDGTIMIRNKNEWIKLEVQDVRIHESIN